MIFQSFNLLERETVLKNVEGEQLKRWLKEYSLGALFRSGELENGFAEKDATKEGEK